MRIDERTRIYQAMILLVIVPLTAFGDGPPIRVAVFQGAGVSASCERLIATLTADQGDKFAVSRLTPEQIRNGRLADFDVLVHPGGSGSKQAESLGKEGRLAVRNYIQAGGGYLGVCAGAYLATNDYTWSLDLIDAKVVDKKHWARGNGAVTIRLSSQGSEFFKHDSSEMSIHYAQGPLLSRKEWDDPSVPDYESLAIYATEIAEKGAPRGVMEGTSAAVRARFGKGRVFCFSPHPELTDGLQHLIPTVVEWLAEKKPSEE